ncbi:MAG: sugar isomerase domain-containing protein [Spirochaetia bacterium]
MSKYYQSVEKSVYDRQEKVMETQIDNLKKAAELLAESWENGKNCWVFSGAGSDIVTQELHFRAGGFVNLNAIYTPFVEFSMRPLPFMWESEKLPGLFREMWTKEHTDRGDTIILHSPAGCSAMFIEAVELFHELDIKVIAITNITLSQQAQTTSVNGKRLYEVADIVIDMCGEKDYGCVLTKSGERLCSNDLLIGTFIAHLLETATAWEMTHRGLEAPILRSVNKPNAATHNSALIEKYKEQIFYPCMQGKYSTYYQESAK